MGSTSQLCLQKSSESQRRRNRKHQNVFSMQLVLRGGDFPKLSPGPATRPGCLGGSGQLHAHQSCTSDSQTQTLCLSGGNCPLVPHIPPCAALQWRWKRKKSKQRARLFHYLTSQLLTTVLLLPSRWAAATTPAWAQPKNSMKRLLRLQQKEQGRPSAPEPSAHLLHILPGQHLQQSTRPSAPPRHLLSPAQGHSALAKSPCSVQPSSNPRQKQIKSN